MPSWMSGPVKTRNSSAGEASKAGSARRSQWLRLYLVQRMALCDPPASRAFAPAKHPRIAVVVFKQNAGEGYAQAAPIAGSIIAQSLPLVKP